MRAGRFADWLYKWRFALFGIWLVHTFLIHYFKLGFLSWDGFGHRGAPIVELYQHGSLGKEKFTEWSLVGYTPWIELVHIPFLYVFKLRGFIIGFPLLVFPLAVVAIYKLVNELTSDRRAATFGAFAYAAIPMVNQQPFTGYIDFAVTGLLAYWIYAVLRMRTAERLIGPSIRLAIATLMFVMARSQGVYVIVVMFPILAYVMFCTREKFRIRTQHGKRLALAIGLVVIGCAPAIGLQIYKYYEYGSPVAPMQFSFLGVKIGHGVTMDTYLKYAGLGGSDLGSLAKGFFEGWVWHSGWPIGAFYASRHMAAGLLFLLALGLLPVFVRAVTRPEVAVIGAGLFVSLLSRDFAVPRWSYTIVIALAIVLGRSMSALAGTYAERAAPRKWYRPVFWVALAIMAVHLLRPEVDMLQMRNNGYISPRLNVTGSKRFIEGHEVAV